VSLSWAHWRYGSLANAAAYIDGRKVHADKLIRELGTVERDKLLKVEFNVINLQNEPLRIVGANASCSCILPPDMPIALEPFTTTPVVFTFRSPETTQPFEQNINLYFDGPIPDMQLKIVGVTQ
jgi:hypothetical protein